jgi:hypothetical protein
VRPHPRQALKWLQCRLGDGGGADGAAPAAPGLTVVTPTVKGWLDRVSACVVAGTPVAVVDIGSDVPPALEALVHRRLFRVGRQLQVPLGDHRVALHPDLKLYLQVGQAPWRTGGVPPRKRASIAARCGLSALVERVGRCVCRGGQL